MQAKPDSVQAHYAVSDLARSILDALARAGTDLRTLTSEDLAPVDEFHIRGREATLELAALAEPQRGWHLLDVGCGLGGTCRHLASVHGCRATGLDLTEAYCAAARELSELVGLADATEFHRGSALDMPFEAETFDAAWTEHAQMNVEDKESFYGEIRRVLRPGGRFAFHDIFAGAAGAPHFPVPWAGEPSISFLAPPERTRELLGAGFEVEHWEDRTQASLEWFRGTLERLSREGPAPLGLHLLMGEDARDKFGNVLRNLEEGRIAVAMAVLTKR